MSTALVPIDPPVLPGVPHLLPVVMMHTLMIPLVVVLVLVVVVLVVALMWWHIPLVRVHPIAPTAGLHVDTQATTAVLEACRSCVRGYGPVCATAVDPRTRGFLGGPLAAAAVYDRHAVDRFVDQDQGVQE